MAPQTITMSEAQQLIDRGSATVEIGPSTHPRFHWNRLHASYRGKPVTYRCTGCNLLWHLEQDDAADLHGVLEAEYRDAMETQRDLRSGMHW